ncbi:MAG: chloride channel protein [Pseudolabrys sp.]|nr:chloride channel protein [Pseudolabrys sp.]
MDLRTRGIGLFGLSILALIVGVVTGFGAVAFRALIAFIHNFAFLGLFSIEFDANQFTPAGPWGAGIILVPVIGGLIVVFLVNNFAPEARGHGVPEVLDAIYYKEGKIRPVVAAIKSLASAISIGTGAAVGREGPIIQIGSSLGSSLGQLISMAPWQRITLVAAGAGAGIAATFNTPIGGVMFAIELMLPELSARTFLPVALATGAATYIGRVFLGLAPAFVVPSAFFLNSEQPPIIGLLLFALLGALVGIAATAFIRTLVLAEDTFPKIKNPYLRNMVGMLMVGLLMYALLQTQGHYFIQGVGYATIQAILQDNLAGIALLLGLFVGKMFATSVSLASGASGGIFSPSLFMGATLGAAFGAIVTAIYPIPGVDPITCAIIGMAAMVGGGPGPAMTAVTMIFEMTRDYDIIMPIIIAVAVAIGVRRLLSRENIYTIKLVARGHLIPKALHANMFLVRHAEEVMDRDVLTLPADTDFAAFLRETSAGGFKHIVVTRDDRIVGVLRVNTELRVGLGETHSGVRLGDIVQKNFTVSRAGDVVFDVVERMWRRKASMSIVTKGSGRTPRGPHVVGMISKEHIADSVADSIRPYGTEAKGPV